MKKVITHNLQTLSAYSALQSLFCLLFSLLTLDFIDVLSFPGSACYYAEVLGLLVQDFFSIFFWGFFSFPTDRPKIREHIRQKTKTVNGLRGTIALLNNTLSTSFLGPFPWRGKVKGPGTKVQHTVIYVLGQYSKRYRASFILQVNAKNIFKKGYLMVV